MPKWFVQELIRTYGGQPPCLDIWVKLEKGGRSFSGEWQPRTLSAVAGRDRLDRLYSARLGPLAAWLDAVVEVLDVFLCYLEQGGDEPSQQLQ